MLAEAFLLLLQAGNLSFKKCLDWVQVTTCFCLHLKVI